MSTSPFTKAFVTGLNDSVPLEKRAGLGRVLKTLAVLGIPLAIGSYAFGKGVVSGQSDRAKREQAESRDEMLRNAYFGT